MAVLARKFLTYDGVIYAPGAELPVEVNMRGKLVALPLDALVDRRDACDPAVCQLDPARCCGRKPKAAKPRARKRTG